MDSRRAAAGGSLQLLTAGRTLAKEMPARLTCSFAALHSAAQQPAPCCVTHLNQGCCLTSVAPPLVHPSRRPVERTSRRLTRSRSSCKEVGSGSSVETCNGGRLRA